MSLILQGVLVVLIKGEKCGFDISFCYRVFSLKRSTARAFAVAFIFQGIDRATERNNYSTSVSVSQR